jgi:tetratricopeptide (TPR) repeat protein
MYLNNPPFNGGDVKKAIETFSACHEAAPEDDVYLVLLAMSYQKDKDWSKALETADKALAANPANPNAAALKKRIEARQELKE